MSSIAEEFVHLYQDAGSIHGTEILSRPIGLLLAAGEALIGIDSARERHLLLPVVSESVPVDRTSAGVALGPRVLVAGDAATKYVDLHCTDPSLALVFERLADDIVDRLGKYPSRPVSTCIAVLDEWRSLLGKAKSVSKETVVGLVGELTVLETLAKRDPVAALQAWRGPMGAIHDFVGAEGDIEVKTTAVERNALTVQVSGIDQLDPDSCKSLNLIVLQVSADHTAPTLDERIDYLSSLGIPKRRLIDTVAEAGYVFEAMIDINTQYSVDSIRLWQIDNEFPSIRRSDIDPGRLGSIVDLNYSISLGGVAPTASDAGVAVFLNSWEMGQ
ncbi:PD-(D/E)XK motif protein [Gordonia paraffinivorans]|uniref:PD-(D/E)XK motif protein n=1 Tax=Gordonia paraffinivorans TaxID=175628 RepID=UPI0014485B2D|nr:PD-(D/E)XK motif protein [Gordonia paraffinivorans]